MTRTILISLAWLILHLSCYKGHGLSPTAEEGNASGIQGRITFLGTWPDSTKEVRVAVLQRYPQGMSDPDSILSFVIENLAAYSDTIPRYVDEYDYTFNLEPDVYAWVLVVWFPDIPLYFFGVKELGAYYQNPEQTDLPTPVNVVRGIITPGIDITADFTNLDRDIPFFKRREGL